MAKFEIQNYLGEVVIASVTQEELDNLIQTDQYNYFMYDEIAENDLVTRWAGEQPDGQIVVDNRIFKQIEE